MKVLVIGGVGFVGLYIVVELVVVGYDVYVVENFCNSECWIVECIECIIGKVFVLDELDICDCDVLLEVLWDFMFDVVIYFVVLKLVFESIELLVCYYDVNVGGIVMLFDVMQQVGCRCIVFSFFVMVYG